jgi:hypothetical protein
MIIETVVTTSAASGKVHVAPMGIREQDDLVLLAPFKPSTTLNNLLETRTAVVNLIDDVRIFAGCVTGRRTWPLQQLGDSPPRARLVAALTHRELEVVRIEEDAQRPRVWCRETACRSHAPFMGFNRAQAAVVEGAILVSRLHMLPAEKIEREVDYLQIAIDKTAGPREIEAWGWLMQAIGMRRQEMPTSP